MKAKKMSKLLSTINGQVYIQIGDNAYPASVRLFEESGKIIPYITIDNTDEHRNFPKNYMDKEIFYEK